MRRIITGCALAFLLLFIRESSALEPSSLLGLDSWIFGQEDRAALNACPAADIGPGILTAIAKATGNLPIGTLSGFLVTDLDADGISEIIAAVDVSGRGLVRDLTIISRNGGTNHCDSIPAYGGEIKLWEANGKQMLVAMQPAYDLSRTDPLITYPLLFSWSGTKCEDVSRRARPYYENIFLPQIKSLIAEMGKADNSFAIEERHRLIIRVASINRTAVKVNGLFDLPLFSKAEIWALEEMLESLSSLDEEHLGGVTGPLLRGAITEAKTEISRLSNIGD